MMGIEAVFCIGWEIIDRLGSDVCRNFGSGDGGEARLEVWGEVGSRYVIIFCTNIKGRINVRLV